MTKYRDIRFLHNSQDMFINLIIKNKDCPFFSFSEVGNPVAFKTLNGLTPAYLANLLSRYLRSQNSGFLVVPRIPKSTKGGKAFFAFGSQTQKPS